MRTGILPIIKLINERLTDLSMEDLPESEKHLVQLELESAKQRLSMARLVLQRVEIPVTPKVHRSSG